jgi:hypothetical protein
MPLRPIDVILPYSPKGDFTWNFNQLTSDLIHSVIVPYTREPEAPPKAIHPLAVEGLTRGFDLMAVMKRCTADFIMMISPDEKIRLGARALERFLEVALDTEAGVIYSDYYEETENGQILEHPVIDYQTGSLRDDFEFGSLLFLSRQSVDRALNSHGSLYEGEAAGLYELRLKISMNSEIARVPELLYSRLQGKDQTRAARLFDYLRPENRKAQIEMERVLTDHLKRIGAFLKPHFEKVRRPPLPRTASVIIPVRNREKTIGEAVRSALAQETNFDFNVIVVDNHSTDGTSKILRDFARRDARLVHLIPERKDLHIGGCWNEALHCPKCGTFAVQLDSDDLYADTSTLQTLVGRFDHRGYAMVIGAYRTTDLSQREIPPGLVDHREWTCDNGRNNLLRVNGLGAPRAFFAPLLRRYPFPNVSYGEDYAVGLRLSRHYEIGRVFEPIYICRRWEGNSDSGLSLEASNRHDTYKDRLRTMEILARQKINRAED